MLRLRSNFRLPAELAVVMSSLGMCAAQEAIVSATHVTASAIVSQPSQDYALSLGDVVTLRSPVVSEMSDKAYRIEADGSVNLPLVGRVSAVGQTIRDFESTLNESLKAFYLEPQISVAITEFHNAPVSVIGAVNNPGIHQVRGRQNILEMLSAAGGLRADAGPILTITREKNNMPIPLAGAHADSTGKFSVAEIKLKDLISAKDPSLNIAVCPNDVLSVPAGEVVYVVGEVKKAGGFPLGSRATMSVLEAVSLAEGLDPKASPGNSYLLRVPETGGERQEIPVNLKAIMAGKSPDVHMRPNDILLVPNSAAKSAAMRGVETAIQIGSGLLIWGRL